MRMIGATKKKSFFQKLKDHYRLVVINDDTFNEVWKVRFNRINILSLIIACLLIGAVSVYVIIAYTPARELVPGYDSELRLNVVKNYYRLDSLENEIRKRDQYFNNINAIISGKVPEDVLAEKIESETVENVNLHKSNEDSVLKKLIQQEQSFSRGYSKFISSSDQIANLHFFPPIKGIVTNSFNPSKSHYGTDIVSPPDEVVKATLEGTITMAHWTLETGNVIQIQHNNNLISVYKHNAALLKNPGEYVEAGEAIAIVGNSGELTTGPHLHFELWHNGSPLNPENFVAF
jgi:murein DD-endopeptidase MepM/ murein hydrolase activator NlpD